MVKNSLKGTVSSVSGPFHKDSGVPRNFVRWGVQQIQLRMEDRDLGVVAPWSGVL